MEASLTHQEFAQQANSRFQVEVDENTDVELELTQVSDLKLYPQQEEFVLVFRGPLDMFLSQGVRNFKHDKMGRFEMFIVPVRQDQQGFYYEAVFNRLRDNQPQ
ncbi:MAG TPA: hypothetical protein VFY34_09750 [Pyrinomonadaceae bacterium]|nr:hypothetical protein [Pyrinomonadaceae bacterium]